MLKSIKDIFNFISINKRGNALAGIIIALIIAAAIIIAVYMYTSSQTHPFWEVK